MTHRRAGAIAAGAVAVLGVGVLIPTIAQATPDRPGEIVGAGSATAIDGSFIVVLNEEVAAGSETAAELVEEHDATVGTVFETVINGYAIEASEEDAARLAADPAVAAVYQDELVTVATETQDDPPSWGLDRIDQPALPLDASYTHPAHGGADTTIYVVDTGINHTHEDFGGRAVPGFDAFGGDGTDDNGHGTHVASTAAGTEYGVAKQASLVSVKVLDATGAGSVSDVIAGVEWITARADDSSVVNMSIGTPANEALDAAVNASLTAGVHYVAAAGNSDQDASQVSPARLNRVITAAASTADDSRHPSSNWGPAVNGFAPGEDITAAWIGDDTATETLTGTSMAAAHTTGVLALGLHDYQGTEPMELWWDYLVESVFVHDAIDDPGAGSGNVLIQVAPPRDPGPLRAFARSDCSLGDDGAWSCTFDGGDSRSRAGIVAYDWNLGDGRQDSGETVTHTMAPGSHAIELTVTDAVGDTHSWTTRVGLSESAGEPVPFWVSTFCYERAAHWDCGSAPYLASGETPSPQPFEWDVDGAIIRGWAFDRSFPSGGEYQITVTAFDEEGRSTQLDSSLSVP
ncbi:S8 family serine peptidase [Streptomyces profundus]|uniref:S8 family serine peptidase n=1 Tax=Streptomyces profundus TaxID=2867410 RepID=UPI001D168D39|nr:S8 family serine peptidase [Streptomyces sp. MA3_2.13]UED86285.1 S8 family serine peptidase [Streptomyces sp. MA3_2.13]